MALDTFFVLANQYDTEADAISDFGAVQKLYEELRLVDTYDAAVLTRKADGRVRIVKRVEEPVRQGMDKGAAVGLAVGVAIALFPAAGLATEIALGGAGALGATVGAVAGHVAGGMRRSDLKELGELLDRGTSGLLVVTASDVESKVEAAIKKAKKRAKAQLQSDVNALKRELEATHA